MIPDKTYRTEFRRTFLIHALPEPLTPRSEHLQIFDNYITETRLRLRTVRVPETKEWTFTLQQRFPVDPADKGAWNIAEIHLNEAEYEHFKPFEGNEVRKNRYFSELDGRMFTFDIYLGPLWGLNRARVDFESPQALSAFQPPPWAVLEITDDGFFEDSNLVDLKFADIQNRLSAAASLE